MQTRGSCRFIGLILGAVEKCVIKQIYILHSLTLLQSNIFLQWMIKLHHHQTIIAISSVQK